MARRRDSVPKVSRVEAALARPTVGQRRPLASMQWRSSISKCGHLDTLGKATLENNEFKMLNFPSSLYTVAEDSLDPDDLIFPRAATRVGHKYQASVPSTKDEPIPRSSGSMSVASDRTEGTLSLRFLFSVSGRCLILSRCRYHTWRLGNCRNIGACEPLQ